MSTQIPTPAPAPRIPATRGTTTQARPSTPAPSADRDQEARMAGEIRTHHSAMVTDLDRLSAALRDAAADDDGRRIAAARIALQSWFADVLVPHADEEELTTYQAAGALPEGRLLIESMVREHVLIKKLVALFQASDGAAAAAYGRAVFEAFHSHQRKENEIILPLLVDSPAVSLVHIMGAAHGHQLGQPEHHHADEHGHAH